MITNHSLEALNDHTLLSQFGVLVRQDNEGNANLLRHIDAIDRRQLWAKLGHPSMFAFLVSRYHMSESTAGKRIGAARTARRFHSLFAMVARGEIHLSGIHRLKAHLTRENHEHVLATAKHKTIRQIEELVARLAPRPDVPATLRALPTRSSSAPASSAPSSSLPAPTPAAAPPASTPALPAPSAFPPMPAPRRSPDPAPLSPGRYKLQLTLGENARDKLKQLQDLLAHQIPNGDPAAIVERALDALLTQATNARPASPASPEPRSSSQSPSQTPPPPPPPPHGGLVTTSSPCGEKCGRATTGAAVLSAKTATAATRPAASNLLTYNRGARAARTPLSTWVSGANYAACGIRYIMPSTVLCRVG